MMRGYYVSAYATSPSFYNWNHELEDEYYKGLRNSSNIVGIEIPYLIASRKYPLDWLLRNISENWHLTVSFLPTLMQLSNIDENFGLASIVESSRVAAVAVVEGIREYVFKLQTIFERSIVTAIHLHSGPRNTFGHIRGSKESFAKSLQEIQKLNWDGVQVNVEHCDAYIPGIIPDKGFLTLSDELDVLKAIKGYGVVLNWGRSAIEYRSPEGPIKHILDTQKFGLLKSFIFSGCTDNPKSIYGCWRDSHMPLQKFVPNQLLDTDSLLDFNNIERVLTILNKDVSLGVKVTNPDKKISVKKSLGLNLACINAIEHVRNNISTERTNGDLYAKNYNR